VPLRPLGVGELLDGAFTAMRRYPKATLGLSAAFAAVQQVLSFLIDVGTGRVAAPSSTGLSAFGTVAGLVDTVINSVLHAVLLGMLAVVIGDAVIGRPVDIGDVWRRVRPLFWPLVGASLLAGILPLLGLIALIIGGVVLWVALSFTTPALVLERLRVGQALSRSWQLAMPVFFRVLGVRALAWLIAAVIAAIVSVPGVIVAFATITQGLASSTTPHFGIGAEIAVRLSALVATTLTAPIAAGVAALLYIDRRMRTEALDVALMQAAALPRR
jgi:hypothetical protein